MLKLGRWQAGWLLGISLATTIAAGTSACSGRTNPPAEDRGGAGTPKPSPSPAPADAKGSDAMTTPPSGGSAEARVTALAGKELGVNPWHLVKVPGVELFYLANPIVYRGVAVIEGSPDVLEGAAAFAAMRKRGVSDAWQLSALALHFLAKGGTPLRDAAEAKGQPAAVVAKVTAPRLTGKTLEFWALDGRAEQLLRYQVDVDAATIAMQPGAQLANAGADGIAQAQKALAGAADTMYAGAIDALVAACADPRAPAALNDVIRKHGHASAREWAAFQAARCHDGETPAALLFALEKDAAPMVRKHAADSLGKLGVAKARPALERAKADPDPNVSGAAGRALAKLPK